MSRQLLANELRAAAANFERQLARVSGPLISKKSESGLRPVVLLPALCRVAVKCRRLVLDAFESTIRRPFFSAQRGAGPLTKSGVPPSR
jgi:hypothetical protein